MSEKTIYQESFELHYNAMLGMFRHLITQFADESVEIAARSVALAAPLPNAINMYNVAMRDLGYSVFASFAFALTLEIVVFLLVEVALRLWDGYLLKPARYRYPFVASIGVVLIATFVVVGIVYVLEPHKIMAFLPVVSLCSFVGIGLKRWDERHNENFTPAVKRAVKSTVKRTVKYDTIDSEDFTPAVSEKVDNRRLKLLEILQEIDGHDIADLNKSALAKRLDVSRPTLLSDLAALQNVGKLSLNGHVKVSQ